MKEGNITGIRQEVYIGNFGLALGGVHSGPSDSGPPIADSLHIVDANSGTGVFSLNTVH